VLKVEVLPLQLIGDLIVYLILPASGIVVIKRVVATVGVAIDPIEE